MLVLFFAVLLPLTIPNTFKSKTTIMNRYNYSCFAKCLFAKLNKQKEIILKSDFGLGNGRYSDLMYNGLWLLSIDHYLYAYFFLCLSRKSAWANTHAHMLFVTFRLTSHCSASVTRMYVLLYVYFTHTQHIALEVSIFYSLCYSFYVYFRFLDRTVLRSHRHICSLSFVHSILVANVQFSYFLVSPKIYLHLCRK